MARRTARTRQRDYRKIKRKFKKVSELDPEMKVVLYGKAGTGKTTLASTFPKPLLLIDCSEKGTDSISDVKGVTVLRAESWDDIDDIYWFLKKEDHGFKTVVIDTVSQAQDLCIKKVLEDKGKGVEEGALGNWGTMTKQDWGTVSTKLKTFVISMRDLPLEGVVFIAHDRVFGGEDEDDESVIAPSVGPRLMPSVTTVLNGAVSVIGNTFIRETFIKRRNRKTKKVESRRKVEYSMRIGPNAYYTTKIRKPKKVELPDSIVDPSYQKLIAYMRGETE